LANDLEISDKGKSLVLGKFRLDRTSLRSIGKIDPEDWGKCGEFLSRAEGSVHWWIGDWIAMWRSEWYKGNNLRKEAYEEASEKTGMARKTIQQDLQVAREWEMDERSSILEWAHHLILLSIEPKTLRMEWVHRAEQGEDGKPWSVAKLKKEILNDKEVQLLKSNNEKGDGWIGKMDAIAFLQSFKAKSVDLLLTDPPYMTDVEDVAAFASGWVPIALSKIRPSGRAYIFTGAYPQEIHAYLEAIEKTDGLRLENILVWTYENTLGPSPEKTYKLNWQACFYLVGPDAPPLDCPIMVEQFTVQDIPAPDGRLGDRFHAWQKPSALAARFIRHSTRPKDLVIDPFAGTGTFILEAMKLGRSAQGSEIDEDMLTICEKRGLKVERPSNE